MPSTIASNTAAIIVNYNGWQDTLLCVRSLLEGEVVPAYMVIVDNHSSDDSYEHLTRWGFGKIPTPKISPHHPLSSLFQNKHPLPASFQVIEKAVATNPPQQPAIFLYRTTHNTGYAGGVNAGLQCIKHLQEIQWLWILNNDVIVHPSALKALLQCTSTNSRTGIWGSKILAFDAPSRLQAVGGRYHKCLAYPAHIGQGELDQGQYDHPLTIDYVVGAAMLVARQFLEEVGPLNEQYFLYFEELDWVTRGKRLGWKVGYCWESRVYHREGTATGGSNPQQKSEISDFYLIRNRLLFTRKYYPWCLPTVYLSFIGVIIRRMIRGQWRRIPKILKILVTHEI